MTKRLNTNGIEIDVESSMAEINRLERRLREIENTFQKFNLEEFSNLKVHIVNRLEKDSIYHCAGPRRSTLKLRNRNAIDRLFSNLNLREFCRLLNHDFAPLLLYKTNEPTTLRQRKAMPLSDFFETSSRREANIRDAKIELEKLRNTGWGGLFSGKPSKSEYEKKERDLKWKISHISDNRDYLYEKNEAVLLEVCEHAVRHASEIGAIDARVRHLRSQINLANKQNRTKSKLAIAAAATGKVRSEAATIRRRVKSSDVCPYCSLPIQGKTHLDHIYPVVKGGLNIEANLVFCCSSCNIKKGDKGLFQFCSENGFQFEEVVRRLISLGKHV